jgi:hypothetical protein
MAAMTKERAVPARQLRATVEKHFRKNAGWAVGVMWFRERDGENSLNLSGRGDILGIPPLLLGAKAPSSVEMTSRKRYRNRPAEVVH